MPKEVRPAPQVVADLCREARFANARNALDYRDPRATIFLQDLGQLRGSTDESTHPRRIRQHLDPRRASGKQSAVDETVARKLHRNPREGRGPTGLFNQRRDSRLQKAPIILDRNHFRFQRLPQSCCLEST